MSNFLQCEKCFKGDQRNFIRHVANNCSCPMAICMNCLRDNKKKTICPGCKKIVRAVQTVDAKKIAKEIFIFRNKNPIVTKSQ